MSGPSYSGPAGVKIYTLGTERVRLQFEAGDGAVMQADLTAAEAEWVANELLSRLTTSTVVGGTTP